MPPEKLTVEDVKDALAGLEGWTFDENTHALNKTFTFADFKEAWAFMNRVALLAEEKCHHPEWFNVYNRVSVTMTTHDAGGVSDFDIIFAKSMNSWAG